MHLVNKFFLILFLPALLLLSPAVAAPALKNIEGQDIDLSSLKGNWVFINYWASWCHPCLEEIPELNAFYSRYKSNQVKVFGFNYDSLPVREQKRLISELGIHYPSLQNDPARLLSLGDIRGIPVTFVLNPDGKLVKTLYGPQTIHSLTRAAR